MDLKSAISANKMVRSTDQYAQRKCQYTTILVEYESDPTQISHTERMITREEMNRKYGGTVSFIPMNKDTPSTIQAVLNESIALSKVL